MYRFNFPRQVIQISHKQTHAHSLKQALFGIQQHQSRLCQVWCTRVNYMLKRKKKVKNSHHIVPDKAAANMQPTLTALPLCPITKKDDPSTGCRDWSTGHTNLQSSHSHCDRLNYTFRPATVKWPWGTPDHHHTKPERSNIGANVSSELIREQPVTDTSYTHPMGCSSWFWIIFFFCCRFYMSEKVSLNAIEDRRRLLHPRWHLFFSSKPRCCFRHTAWSMFWL